MEMCNKFITFLVLTFMVSISFAQQYTPMTAAGYQYKRAKVDSTLHIPSFCGVPTLRNSTAIQGAIAMDTCANKLYQWTNAAGWSIISGAGGGGGTLQSVTDSGNTTTNDIQLLNHARVILGDSGEVLLDNGSKLRMGAIDAQTGGSKGIALICAVGYEMKWEGGSLYVMNDQGFTVREVRYKFSSIPTATDDGSKGFYPGSRWVLDNGTLYTCSDSTSGAAVWQNTTYPSLQDVATVGNYYVNDNGDTLRLNSIDGNNKHPILWTNDQYGGQPTNILDFSYNPGFIDNVAKIKFGVTSGLGTGYIEITDNQSIFKNELSQRTIIQNAYSALGTTQTTYFPLIKNGTDTLATTEDIRNSAIDTSNKWVNNIYRTSGKDSIIYFIGSTRYAIKDSVGTNPAPVGYYGAFQDNTSQTAASINTAYPVKFNTTDLTNGVSVVNDGSSNPTRVTLANTGIYNIQFSLQLEKTGGSGNMIADIWIRKNGVDIPSTTGKVVLTGSANASPVVAAWNYVLDLAAGDYVQLMWATSNTNVEIVAAAATSPHPAIPSSILTVTQQSGIMAGTGITAINSLTGAAQTMVTGTDSTDFKIVSTGTTHKFNLPTASATNRGALSSANWSTFNSKLGASDTVSLSNRINLKVNIADTATMLSKYLRKTDTASLSSRIDLRVKYTDTATMLTPYLRKTDTASLSSRINLKVNIADTSSMLTPYLRSNTASATYLAKSDSTIYYTKYRSDTSRTNIYNALLGKQGTITLTTTGTSGAATLIANTLNIPQYAGATVGGVTGNIQYNNGTTFAGSNDLFWDNTNTRLGIGQTTPTSRFHLNFNQNSVTQSDANGILLANTTAAIAGTQSISPAIVWQGNGWKTTATAASQDVRFRADVLPVQGTANANGTWTLASSINGGAYINRYQTSSAGTHTFYDASGTSLLTLNNTGTITMGGGQISSLVSITASTQFKSGSNTATAAYRTTNAGGDVTPTAFFGASETNTAGTLAYATDVTNGLSFTAGNGTRQIARAGINITNLTNTAGSESGDLIFSTQSGGTAMSEKMRIFAAGNVTIGNAVDQGLKLYVGGTVGFSSTLSIGTSAAVGSQLQLAGTSTVTNAFSRLISGGASTTPYLAAGNLGSTAGNTAITIDPTNQLSFMSFNTGGFRTLRGSIQVTNLNNTAGSDAGDMIFLTQSGGTAMSEKMRITGAGGLTLNPTNTASGTTGNQTINKASGTVNIAAGGTTLTVTNSLVSATSIVYAVIRTNDATATIKNVVPAAGSFVINLGAATTAETSIGFFVIN